MNLPVGNTEVAATMIQDLTDGKLFCIEAVQPYPQDYSETTEVAQKELCENVRPTLVDHIDNINEYDVIFLGYPNWWGTMPMAVFTFLEENDFTGKMILTFCTHEGSGMGRSEKDCAKLCPGATVHKGLAIHGTRVKDAKPDIEKWLD